MAAKSSARTVSDNSREEEVDDEPHSEIEHGGLGELRSAKIVIDSFYGTPLRRRSPAWACCRPCCSRAVRAPVSASAVDASLARESLKLALDHWKKGEEPSSLQSSATPMIAQDFEWAAGAKLLDYQILDDGKEEDANLRVQVKITLAQEGKNKTVEKTASYVVGTSPSVTVFRDIMKR